MIDEKKLIEHLQNCVNYSDNTNFTNGLLSAIDIVNQQPKIGEWIPCSERLPEENGYYLCTMWSHEVMICEYGWNSPKTKKDFFRNYCAANVIAWQPLPAPYEVKSDE